MAIKLYELAGADEKRRFSPYCWRVHLALRHKGLDFDTLPWRFTEKDRIAHASSDKVPVVEDGAATVADSWKIALYLEDTYPDRPSLFGSQMGRGMARFVTDWTESVVQAGMFPMVVADIHGVIAEKDKIYFRESREKRFGGKKLEEVQADRESRLPAFRAALTPLRLMLGRQPFIAGAEPAWADFAAFSAFQWARCVSPFQLLAQDDPVFAWRERMLDLFGGVARKTVGFAV